MIAASRIVSRSLPWHGPLLEALDRFWEATGRVRRTHRLGALVSTAEASIGRVFAEQGRLLRAAFGTLRGHFHEAGDDEQHSSADAGLIDAVLIAFGFVALATVDDLSAAIAELASASLLAGAEEQISTLGLDGRFTLANPRAMHYLTKYDSTRAGQLDDTTRRQLQTLVTNGVAAGLSYDALASQISEFFATMSTERARQIAVYESRQAFVTGQLSVGQDVAASGLALEKAWVTAGDEYVDDAICGANEAQGWIPLDDLFQSGDDAPLGHPRCRCELQLRLADAATD